MNNGWYQLESDPRKKQNVSSGQGPRRPNGAPSRPPDSYFAEMRTIYSRSVEKPRVPTPPPPPVPEPAPVPDCACPAPVKEPEPSCLPDPYQDGLRIKHSQTVGECGPVLVQDMVLHETLETFVNSKPLERAVHVKGYGAFGTFQTCQSMQEYTTLDFLQKPGQCTPVTARFSLAVSNRGTPDTSRNVRGFSVKFYTGCGVFDLLSNHIPVFLVRDAIRFPESIQAFLPSPVNNLIDPERFWNFIARAPEATHFVTWLYSDVGTLKSLRHLHTSSVNTYVWKNAEGKRRYVKYHWIPLAGEEYIDRAESIRLAGERPDIAGRDLYDSIAAGTPAEYNLCVQLMDPDDAEHLCYDPLDDTKIWSKEDFPLIPLGKLTLDRNPENYAEQVEKLAFSPSNLLEGAELSDDKMLQGRSFIYSDAQRHRLGPDFRKIPINRQETWRPDDEVSSGIGQCLTGCQMRSPISKQDNFSQAGERYCSLSAEEKEHLTDNIASELYQVSEKVKETVLGYFRNASPEFAERVSLCMKKYQKC